MAVRAVESILNMERLVSGHPSISHDNLLRDLGVPRQPDTCTTHTLRDLWGPCPSDTCTTRIHSDPGEALTT